MQYSILIHRSAQKELASLPSKAYDRVKLAIQKLASNPRPRGSRKLKGREGFRVRSGEYRIIYEINYSEKIVTIFNIGHRRDIYE